MLVNASAPVVASKISPSQHGNHLANVPVKVGAQIDVPEGVNGREAITDFAQAHAMNTGAAVGVFLVGCSTGQVKMAELMEGVEQTCGSQPLDIDNSANVLVQPKEDTYVDGLGRLAYVIDDVNTADFTLGYTNDGVAHPVQHQPLPPETH